MAGLLNPSATVAEQPDIQPSQVAEILMSGKQQQVLKTKSSTRAARN